MEIQINQRNCEKQEQLKTIQTDGLFVLFFNLNTGVWTGAEDSSVRFRDLNLGQGANMALPIWGYIFKRFTKKII